MKNGKSIAELFQQYLEDSFLISHDSMGLIAVSGGVDSVVLLHLLYNVADKFRLKLGVAHYNHKIRGIDADKDEEFVRMIALNLNLPFYKGTIPSSGSENQESWESFARRKRYAFLEKIKQKEKYDWIATAHHADDQTETILLRVIQGSGMGGLQGIRKRRGSIIRPLLTFSKEQIINYSVENDIQFREDSTNSLLNHPRNYLRYQVIPLLKKLNPGLNNSIRRLAHNMDEMDEFTRTIISWCGKAIIKGDDSESIKIDADLLTSYPIYLQKRIILDITSEGNKIISHRHYLWHNLEQFLKTSKTGNILLLHNDWTLLRDRDCYCLKKIKMNESNSEDIDFELNNIKYNSITIGDYKLLLDLSGMKIQYSRDPLFEYVDYDKLSGKSLKLRLWQPGDRMKPLGLGEFKKVSDILIDRKVDRFRKKSQYVLTANNRIVWLCGIQLDDRYKVHKSTKKIVRLEWSFLKNEQD